MAFKLIEAAQTHWRIINAPHLVRGGAEFKNGTLVNTTDESTQDGHTP